MSTGAAFILDNLQMRNLLICAFFVTVLSIAFLMRSSASEEPIPKVKAELEENCCISKGGVGIINPDVYVVTDSEKNEIILGKNHKLWLGLSRDKPQTMIVLGDQVIDPNDPPKSYRLENAIIISFEAQRIKFLDLGGKQAGFYPRFSR
jgi:hypothetical protein